MRRLNKELNLIEGACVEGLLMVGLEISGDAKKLTPVVTGNLRNSTFVVGPHKTLEGNSASFADPAGKLGRAAEMTARHRTLVAKHASECHSAQPPEVHVGYTAVYAPFVHENPRAGRTGGMRPPPSKRRYAEGTYATQGQWKFLETAVKQGQGKFLSIMAKFARRRGAK